MAEDLSAETAPPTEEARVCAIPEEHLCAYCPTCGSRLEDSRCKLLCRFCGFFLSCADFY